MRNRGLLYTILAVFGGVLFAGAIGLAWVDYRFSIGEARDTAKSAAEAYASQTRQNLAELRFAIDWLAARVRPDVADAGLDDGDRAQIALMVERLPGLSGLIYVDGSGILRFASASDDALGRSMRDRDYFRAARDRKTAYYIGPTVRARGSRRLVHTYSRRIERDGAFAGVVLASVVATQWNDTLGPLLRVPGSRLRLIRGDGAVVVHQYRDGAAGRLRALIGDSLQQAVPAASEMIVARAPVEDHGLTVETAVPRDAAMAPWRERLIVVIATGVLGLAALAVFGAFGLLALRREARADALLRQRTEALETRTAELDRSLGTQKLLMAELEHRVRNSLSLAASVLSLQRSEIADEASRNALDEARARIQAIARVHDRLKGEENPAATRLDEYVAGLCEDLAANTGTTHRIDTEPVTMPTETAVPLGLVLTELMLNAAKYGANGQPARIDVAVREAAGGLSIEVRDYGAGLDPDFDPEGRTGLGMRLITAMTRQVGGALEWEDAAPGARFTIRLPKDETGAAVGGCQDATSAP